MARIKISNECSCLLCNHTIDDEPDRYLQKWNNSTQYEGLVEVEFKYFHVPCRKLVEELQVAREKLRLARQNLTDIEFSIFLKRYNKYSKP
jgi:hypothetical protein